MIDTHLDSSELVAQLEGRQRTRRTQRSGVPRRTLRELYELMPLAGVSRIANISWLSPSGISVYQASRPDVYSHPFFGQNTGAQGKGFDAKAAQMGAIMEAIESYSAEPRGAWLVRGSYDFLRNTHAILPPLRFWTEGAGKAARQDEPLMWTSAFSLERRLEVLVPAETVFFPFFPAQYQTRSLFPSNSTGLGAGGDLLEAAVHALYEVIERHFRGMLEQSEPRVEVERFENRSLRNLPWFSRLLAEHPELEPCVLRVQSSDGPGYPAMVVCVLIDEQGNTYPGFGCHLQPLVALEKAITESVQSAVTVWAGAREDNVIRGFTQRHAVQQRPSRADLPPESLPLNRFVTSRRRRPATFREEIAALLRAIHRLGFPDVLFKNLTRVGLRVPVVRAIVPGMVHPAGWVDENHEPVTEDKVAMCRFALDL